MAQQQLRHKIKQTGEWPSYSSRVTEASFILFLFLFKFFFCTDAYYAKLLQANEKLSKGHGGTSETCASLIESLAPSAQEGEGEVGERLLSVLVLEYLEYITGGTKISEIWAGREGHSDRVDPHYFVRVPRARCLCVQVLSLLALLAL